MPLLLLSACGGSKDPAPKHGASGPMVVDVTVLHPHLLANIIRTTGSLMANEAVEVRSEVAGRVEAINFREGRPVEKGQVLVRINDDDLQAQLHKADLAVQLAQDDEARKKQLLAVHGISQQDYDDARIALQSAQADRDNLQALIAKTVIRAPFSGKIGLRQVSVGGYVSPNTLITDLQQVSPIKLQFAVPGRYGHFLGPGGEVSFTLDGDTTKKQAQIYAIDPAVDPATRTIAVRARNPNKDGRLRPGAFAHITAVLDRDPAALSIPSEALIPDVKGQKVTLIKKGKAVSVRVQTGIRTDTDVQLTAGVQPGDTVITTGLLQLREGMAVKAAPPGPNSIINEADSSAMDPE